MTPEKLARHQARMEQDKREEPLREARATIDYKKNQAADAVKARELGEYKEQKAFNQLLCLDIAQAIHRNETAALDLYVTTYLKDKLSFNQPSSLEDIQNIFNRLSNRPEELIDIGQPESPKVEMRTVYYEASLADNKKVMTAITITADYTYNATEPLVTFIVSEAPKPKKEALQAVSALTKPKKAEVNKSSFADVLAETSKKTWAFGKKLLGLK